MIERDKQFLWTEKFRPRTIDECILPKRITEEVKGFVAKGEISQILLSGPPGMGKTTLAYAIAKEIDADLLYINASLENGVDTIRMKVTQFASTASFEGNLKIVMLDEADRLSAAAQDSLRPIFEIFAQNTRFILTCNNPAQITEALHSRLTQVDFKIPADEKQEIAGRIFKRLIQILTKEDVEFDKKAVAALVSKEFPDFRRMLNQLQRCASRGGITADILVDVTPAIDELLEHMKAKKFMEVRKWVAKNGDMDPQIIFRLFYDRAVELFVPDTIPACILLLAQYQQWARSVMDQEINTMACLMEIMGTVEWKK